MTAIDDSLAHRFASQHGVATDAQIRAAGTTWRRQQHLVAAGVWRRAAPGVIAVLELIAERTTQRLPRSWFQRLAHRELAELGISLVHEHPVRAANGRLLAELDLADVEHRIGVECQSWEWHATPAAQRADARRKRAVRRLGWEIVDVWWSDRGRMDDVVDTVRTIREERARRAS